MTEYRCNKCHRLFFRAKIKDASIEIKCPKCGYVQNVTKLPPKKT